MNDKAAANYGYIAHKGKTLKRLARIEGQVRGISNMVVQDKYCIDVLTQIAAAQRAFDSVAMELLESHVQSCMHSDNPKKRSELTAELIGAVSRLVKTS